MKTKIKYSGMLGAVLAGAALLGGGAAWAQSGPDVAAAGDEATPVDTTKDVIIVTGTRLTGLAAVDSPAPIQVLDIGTLEDAGHPDLLKALALAVPSFNAQAFGGDMANMTLSAKLRGVSPNHTLVLLNGKRRHGTANLAVLGGAYQGGAAADLNFVPLASVDHVEVLLEGAAAQYGSDAIAGVINIIQKQADSGGQIAISGGEYIDGGGTTGDITANLGAKPTENSYLNLTAEVKYHGFSFRGDMDPRTLNTAFNTTSSSRLSNYPGLVNAKDYPYMNRIAGDAEYRLYTGSYNFGADISDTMEFYSFGTIGYKFAQAYENYRVPSLVVGANGVRPRPLGFSPKEATDEIDYAVTTGLSGDGGGWKYDLSTTYGKDNHSISVLNSLNRALYIDTSTPTRDGFSPSDFHAGDFIGSQWTTNLDVAVPVEIGMASPLTIAVGAEYREDTYEIKPGDAASRYKEGSQSYPGFALTDAGKHARDSKAVYVDLAVDPIKDLQVDAAIRYEDFSDFGDTTVAKLTSRYDFNDAFAIRGTVSTGFRAPTLAESFYSATNVSPTAAFVQLPPNSAAATLIGVNGLDPEKSKNISMGFVLHPMPDMTMTIDAYQIEIEDRIVGSGSLFGVGGAINSPAVVAAIAANGNVLDPTVTQQGISIFTNGLDTKTQGVDFVMTFPSDFGELGSIDWSLTANYTKTDVTRIAPPPSQLAAGVSLFDRTAIGYLETTAPEFRFIASADWTLGPFSINLKEAYYGESSLFTSRTGATYYETKIDATFITDLDIAYNVTDDVKVSVGANNLFNEYPNEVNATLRQEFFSVNSNAYVTKYPTFSPFGINGGYYYGKISYSF